MEEKSILPISKCVKIKNQTPLILYLKSENKNLFLYGCKHSENLENKQYKDIELKLKKFIKLFT